MKHVEYGEFTRLWERVCFVARAASSQTPLETRVVTERDPTGRILRQYEVTDDQPATGYLRVIEAKGFTRWLRRVQSVGYRGPGRGFWISAMDLGLIPTDRVPYVKAANHVAGLRAASEVLRYGGVANDVWIRYH